MHNENPKNTLEKQSKDDQKLNDQIKRFVDKDSEDELSPMNPPDPYSPPSLETVNFEDYHTFIKKLVNEHKVCLKAIEDFENVLGDFQNKGMIPDKDFNEGLRLFFTFFDNKITLHNQKEEKFLFPLLQARLLENGEHSTADNGESVKTAIDMLEDDHIKMMQSASVTFNILGLASRLPDPKSRAITLDTAVEQGKSLIELIRLHIFREDNILFPLAQKYIKKEEFDEMEVKLTLFDNI